MSNVDVVKYLMGHKEYIDSTCDFVDCPICKKKTLNNYFICPTCGWEYDASKGFSYANNSYVWVYRIKFFVKSLFKK